jgi:hypothetical protein
MYKDWKIGLAAGLILALIAVVRLAVDPRLGVKARLSNNNTAAMAKEPLISPPPASAQTITDDETSAPTVPLENYFERRQAPIVISEELIFSQTELPPGQGKPEQSQVIAELPIQDTQAGKLQPQVDRPSNNENASITTQRFHIVQKDQSLWSISSLYYGRGDNWNKILEANRSTIKDPNKIALGTKLIIPN